MEQINQFAAAALTGLLTRGMAGPAAVKEAFALAELMSAEAEEVHKRRQDLHTKKHLETPNHSQNQFEMRPR